MLRLETSLLVSYGPEGLQPELRHASLLFSRSAHLDHASVVVQKPPLEHPETERARVHASFSDLHELSHIILLAEAAIPAHVNAAARSQV